MKAPDYLMPFHIVDIKAVILGGHCIKQLPSLIYLDTGHPDSFRPGLAEPEGIGGNKALVRGGEAYDPVVVPARGVERLPVEKHKLLRTLSVVRYRQQLTGRCDSNIQGQIAQRNHIAHGRNAPAVAQGHALRFDLTQALGGEAPCKCKEDK